MYRGLLASAGLVGLFGGFLIGVDFVTPIGLSFLGLPALFTAFVMLIVGLFAKEPLPIEPEAGKKFCWYCMEQISMESTECPTCSLKQPAEYKTSR